MPGTETAALKLAAADQQALSCAFKEAEALRQLSRPWRRPPRRSPSTELVKDSQQRRCRRQGCGGPVKLEEAMAASRADGLRDLSAQDPAHRGRHRDGPKAPAGCDKHLASRSIAQLAMIRRRASDQDAAKAQALAASRAKSVIRPSCRACRRVWAWRPTSRPLRQDGGRGQAARKKAWLA